ncbi:MAG: hypothetical protein GTN86_13150, partial [Xanthomonadales bacterium]|nr:hypothetical protein [Xanthomonadales bacterium]NIP75095.1 hypothetical protein [Xanthomonadales bacterium]NIQ36835.1 hypothetical protein [Xanthomonadales bacterium]
MKTRVETAHWRLSFERLLWLSAAMALVLAPHAVRIPVWISVLFL